MLLMSLGLSVKCSSTEVLQLMAAFDHWVGFLSVAGILFRVIVVYDPLLPKCIFFNVNIIRTVLHLSTRIHFKILVCYLFFKLKTLLTTFLFSLFETGTVFPHIVYLFED